MVLTLTLFPVMSIFTIPGIQLSKDPGYRSSSFPKSGVNLLSLSRRQSMLLWSMEWPSIQLISLEVAMARWGTSSFHSVQPWFWFRPPASFRGMLWSVGCCTQEAGLYEPFSKMFKLYSVEERMLSWTCCYWRPRIKALLHSKVCFWRCVTRSFCFKWRFIFH